MKNISKPKTKKPSEGLSAEYRFDYAKAKPNRFAGKVSAKSVVVLLDPDVSKVFKDGDSVNAVLRSLIDSMPPVRKSARR